MDSDTTTTGAALGPKACRAVSAIPQEGHWYFEISPKCEPNKQEACPLGELFAPLAPVSQPGTYAPRTHTDACQWA